MKTERVKKQRETDKQSPLMDNKAKKKICNHDWILWSSVMAYCGYCGERLYRDQI